MACKTILEAADVRGDERILPGVNNDQCAAGTGLDRQKFSL